MSIAGNKFEAYKCCANDVIFFKLIRSEKDFFSNDNTFHPDMSHQLFGESEHIFGYKDLRINIYCLAARMTTYVKIDYTDKITPETCDGLSPDDIRKILREQLTGGFTENKDEFLAQISKEKDFRPFGNMVHSYTVTKENQTREFEIYRTENIDECSGFREYHNRLQPFLLFYVDAASYIDIDDDKWTYYLLLEKYNGDEGKMHAFAGYATMYNYYAYPEKIRPRISQVLVMPPFQRQGHGATLIQTFYDNCFTSTQTIQDITVEDPSENFQRVRDFVDAKNCMTLETFHPDKLAGGFSEEMVKESRDRLLINKKQARRVYEILRFKNTDQSNPADLRAYRLDIKNRLNRPFQKTQRDFKKLQKVLNDKELSATMNNLTAEQKMDYLEKTYNELVDEYRIVVDRLVTWA